MEAKSDKRFRYELEDKLGGVPLLLYGIQWFLVTIPTLIIVGALVGGLQYGNSIGQVFYIQKLFALVGLALIVQVLWGHRLPIVIGPATVLLVGIIATQSQGFDAIYSSIIIGGLILFILSFTPLIKRIKSIFTPRIIAVILALIAITLTPTILKMCFSGDVSEGTKYLFFITFFVFLLIANHLLSGIWKSTVLLWGMIIGTLVYRAISSDWSLGTPMGDPAEREFFISSFVFDPGVLLSFICCYVALFINELGSVQAVGQAIGADRQMERNVRGLRVTGLSNAVNGCFGIIGPVDFSISPGIIMTTGCASRYALIPAGIGLILCAVFPNVVVFLTSIPEAVMGGILFYLMCMQLGSSLQLIGNGHLINNFEDALVIAVPLMLALYTSFLPQNMVDSIPGFIQPIVANGFVVGVISVILMEHLLHRQPLSE